MTSPRCSSSRWTGSLWDSAGLRLLLHRPSQQTRSQDSAARVMPPPLITVGLHAVPAARGAVDRHGRDNAVAIINAMKLDTASEGPGGRARSVSVVMLG